jgi:hypothetical protein
VSLRTAALIHGAAHCVDKIARSIVLSQLSANDRAISIHIRGELQ